MRSFHCRRCGQMIFFENSACLRCGAELGVAPDLLDVVTLTEPDADGGMARLGADDDEPPRHRCANAGLAACNWLVEVGGTRCRCCELTRTIPDDDVLASDVFADTEAAKRRLVFQLLDLGLLESTAAATDEPQPIFDLLSSQHDDVTIGHVDGVITIDVDEADDAARAQVRQQLGEPYRTMLGHFRHEIGHYYWPRLIEADPDRLAAFRERFGDERVSYADALTAHYGGGPPPDWADHFVSAYATMHPWEDWAETFAHLLHIRDTLQTAAEHGLRVDGVDATDEEPAGSFPAVLASWLPVAAVLNELNRSLGKSDLYPFVIAAEVADKLAFVHDVISIGLASRPAATVPDADADGEADDDAPAPGSDAAAGQTARSTTSA